MPLQSRLDRLAHRLSSHKRSKTPSLRPAEQNLRSPPAPSSSVAAASPSSTSSNVSKSTSSATSLQLAGLWKEAYEKLRSEDEKLIHEYENALVQRWQPAGGDEGQNKREGGNDGTGSTDRNLQAIVEQRLQEISSSQLTLTVAGKEIVVKDQLRRVVRGILAVKDSVSVAVGADPHAALAWAGVLLLLTPVVRAATQDGDAADAFETMSSLLVRYRVIEEDGRIQAAPTALSRQATAMDTLATHIRSQIVHLYAAVLRFQMRLLKHFSRSGFVRLWEDVTVTDDWKEILETIKDLDKSIAMDLRVFNDHVLPSVKVKLDGLQEGLNKSLTLMVEARDEAKSAKQAQLLGSLSPAPNAAFNSFDDQHKSACLAGTQVELLQHIHAWCDSPGGKCIYWLKGMAGTGKSTISRTLAAACHDRLSLVAGETVPDHVRLGASFFFEQRKAEQNNARKLFTTICRQLADSLPDLRDDICQAISDHQNIANEAMSNQWKHLILQPLLALEKRTMVPLTLVVVIDALDECESSRDISTLLRLVAEAERLTTTLLRLKLFITSRPESHIRTSFLNLPDTAVGERELQKVQVHANGVKDDITLFLEHELSQIGRRYVLSDAWPGEEKTKRLALKSDGLFIYAATVCRFLGEQRSLTKARLQSRMEMIFDDRVSKGLPQQSLDTIYRNILQHSLFDEAVLDDEKEDTYDMFRCVVGAIVILLEPLSVTALANLLPYPERDQIDETLDGLYSLLSKGEEQANNEETSTVQLLHLSFRDFLLDEQRCGQEFWIDQQKVHRELLEYCMQAMCESLKRDVCELSDHSVLTLDVPLARVNCHLPPHVQYACQYWVEHLRNAKIQPLDDHGNSTSGSSIHAFLTKHLLHWLEAMILTRKMTEAVQALLDLLEYIFSLPSEGRIELRKFVHGARRFVLHFRPTIERAPLQLYVSALIYCPELSVVRAQFQDEIPKTFVGLPEVEKDWSPLLQTFEAHRSSFSGEVCLSPDGKLVVCASSLRLWDTATGALLKTYEPGGGPDAIATFSANGERLMSLCDDGYVRVWDVSPGLLVHETPGSTDNIMRFFSHDNTLAIMLLNPNTVEIVHVGSQTPRRHLEAPEERIMDLALSQDNMMLAAACEKNIVLLWTLDANGDQLRYKLRGHSAAVTRVAFSPDGTRLASLSEDNTICLWDPRTGTLAKEFHGSSFKDVIFSSDSRLLIYGEEDRRNAAQWLDIWDLMSDKLLHRIPNFHCVVLKLSPDGSLLTSVGEHGVYTFGVTLVHGIQIVDVASGTLVMSLVGPSKIRDVSFSPDLGLVASSSPGDTIQLWDSSVRPVLDGSVKHVSVKSVQLSSNYQVAVSFGKELNFWDVNTGMFLETLRYGDEPLAVSPNMEFVVFRTGEDVIWGPATGEHWITIENCSQAGRFIFSSDNRLFLHEDTHFEQDGNSPLPKRVLKIGVWETASGTLLHTFHGYLDESVWSFLLELSLDNRFVAIGPFGEDRKLIEIWDVSSGQLHQTVKVGRICWAFQVIWMPDGRFLIAWQGYENVVEIWDMDSGTLRQSVQLPNDEYDPLAVSPDSELLLIERESTLELWDLATLDTIGKRSLQLEGHRLSFSADGRRIVTNYGRLDIRSFYPDWNGSDSRDLFVDGDWVISGTKRVLLLPHDYRPTVAVAVDDTLIIGHRSGFVTFLKLASVESQHDIP